MKFTWRRLVKLFCGIALLTIGFACQKSDLPESYQGDPQLFIRGKFMGQIVNLTVDSQGRRGVPLVYDDSSQAVRIFSFTVIDSLSFLNPSVVLKFTDFQNPPGALNTDLDNTFNSGNKPLADYFSSNPTNPLQLNTFTLEVQNQGLIFSSRKLFSDTSFCKIDSVKDMTWLDANIYKMVYLSFSCSMVHANFPQDSIPYPFLDGKAAIAFPKK